MYIRSTWLASFSLHLMLKSILGDMEGMSRCITRAAVALCACLCGIHTPLEVVCRYFVQPCEVMNMWVSFHPILRWAGQKLGLSFRAESQWRGRISRPKIDWEQKGRGESGLGVGDMEGGGGGGVRGHVQMHVDTQRWTPTHPQQWPLDYIRDGSHLV